MNAAEMKCFSSLEKLHSHQSVVYTRIPVEVFDVALEAQVVFPSHLGHQCFQHNLAGNTEIGISQLKG